MGPQYQGWRCGPALLPKQRAVKAALGHPNGAGKSDQQIAKHCGVSAPMVAGWREKIAPSLKSLEMNTRTVTRKGTTYQQNTANIGRKIACGKTVTSDSR